MSHLYIYHLQFRYKWLKKRRFERRRPPFENGLEIRAQTLKLNSNTQNMCHVPECCYLV